MMPIFAHYINRIVNLLFPQKAAILNLENLFPAELHAYASTVRKIHPDLDITALFDYRNEIIRGLIWQLKYKGNVKVARLFAECLYYALLTELEEASIFENFSSPIIIALPLSKKRERERGYNQCELILGALREIDKGNLFQYSKKILKKIIQTPPQTSLKDKDARLRNLKNCFVADPILAKDRNIILLDDVTTTGTTLKQARRSLLSSGARRVLCLALAH